MMRSAEDLLQELILLLRSALEIFQPISTTELGPVQKHSKDIVFGLNCRNCLGSLQEHHQHIRVHQAVSRKIAIRHLEF